MTESTSLPTPKQKSPRSIFVLVGLFTLCSWCALGVMAFWMLSSKPVPRIVEDAQMQTLGTLVVGRTVVKKAYVPTSQYIEKGADSNVTKLDMGKTRETSTPSRQLSDGDVSRVISSHQNELIHCYAQGLADDESLSGRVDFHFRIAADGHVAMVKITRSGLEHKATEDCFVSKSRKWTFPKHTNKALARFDTHFNFVAD